MTRSGQSPRARDTGHGRPDAERPGCVAGGGDDAPVAAPAHHHGQARQGRLFFDLDGREKGVHIDVEDAASKAPGTGFGLSSSTRGRRLI